MAEKASARCGPMSRRTTALTILTNIQFRSTLSTHTPLPFPPNSCPPTRLISGSLAPTPLSAHLTTSIARMILIESDSVGSPHCSKGGGPPMVVAEGGEAPPLAEEGITVRRRVMAQSWNRMQQRRMQPGQPHFNEGQRARGETEKRGRTKS